MIYRTIVKKSTKSLVNAVTNNVGANAVSEDDEDIRPNEVDDQGYNEPEEFVEAEEVIEAPVVEPKGDTPAPKDDLPFSDNDEF